MEGETRCVTQLIATLGLSLFFFFVVAANLIWLSNSHFLGRYLHLLLLLAFLQ